MATISKSYGSQTMLKRNNDCPVSILTRPQPSEDHLCKGGQTKQAACRCL